MAAPSMMEGDQVWGDTRSASRGSRWAVGDASAFARSSTKRRGEEDDEEALKWIALEKLPTYDRLRTAILKNIGAQGTVITEEVDVTKLGYAERQYIIEQILQGSEEEHEKFLLRLRDRINRSDLCSLLLFVIPVIHLSQCCCCLGLRTFNPIASHRLDSLLPSPPEVDLSCSSSQSPYDVAEIHIFRTVWSFFAVLRKVVCGSIL